MNVAVGRLQVTVRLVEPRRAVMDAPVTPQADALETAYRRERALEAAAADRERWAESAPSRGGFIQ